MKKKIEKRFSFSGNYIWIGCIKLSLLTREYLSSAVNVLTVLRFYISLGETLSNSIAFTVIKKYGKIAAVQNSAVFGSIYHVACQRILWEGTF